MYQLWISGLLHKSITQVWNDETVFIAKHFIFNNEKWERWEGLK